MLEMIIIILCVAVAVFLYTAYLWYKTNEKLTYMLDSLDNDDVNFRFRERLFLNVSLNKTLNRLRGIYEKRRDELKEQEQYFVHMLENVQTGIIVLDSQGRVFYYNKYARELLGMESVAHLRQIRRYNESLYQAFMGVQPGNAAKYESP